MSDGLTDGAEAEDAGEWRRVSPLSILAQMAGTIVSGIIPAAFVLYGAARNEDFGGTWTIIPVMLAILGFSALASWLKWVRLRYRVGTSDVRVEQGLVSRSARSVPYERIQDVSLEQKLVARLLGLVEVRFETGAGGKDELHLAFVSEAEGERLRETVRAMAEGGEIAKATAAATAIAGEQQAVPALQATTLFAMGPGRLLTFGLFSFSLVAFGALAGAAQQFDFLLPFDIWDIDGWEKRLTGPGAYLAGLGELARIIGVVLALATFLMVGLVTGIARTFLRDWGFLLERTAKGFRRRRGLLTKTDVVMPVQRVQALAVTTGLLRRRFGWHGLSFISLAQDAGSANHEVAPFAQMAEIEPIAREAGFALPDEGVDWHRPSPKYHSDRALLRLIVPGLLAVVAIVLGQVLAGLAIAGLAALLVAREYYLWRYERHALDPAQVLSRRGWLAPRLQIASRVKLHSAEIAQGPIARRRGYCDLNLGLAGGRLAFVGLPLADAQAMRAAVLDSIAAVDFAKLPR